MRPVRRLCLIVALAALAAWSAAAPALADPLRSRAMCRMTGKVTPENLITACSELIQLSSDIGEARATLLVVRGRAFLAKGAYELAMADFNEALKVDVNNIAAFHNRGLAWLSKADFANALADLNTALRLSPRNVPILMDLARAYDASGDYERAIADYSTAIE